MDEGPQYTLSNEDWSLHRKGYDDQKRHRDKVEEAIRNNLGDLITEENIIMSKGKDVVKVPIRSLDEFHIRYNYDKNKHVGQGRGDSKEGDVVARIPGSKPSGSLGKGEGAGEQAGEDYIEAEVSLLEIEETLFAQLELPNLDHRKEGPQQLETFEFNDIRRAGLMGNIDKKKTLLQAYKRNALDGKSSFYPVFREDFRFRTWSEITKPDSKAVVLMLMDTSGSMGPWEKYMARSFYFWMIRFLRSKYSTVDIEFIAHHTEAKVVTEEEFFNKGESGGTICSSAYRKALERIQESYHPNEYNIYVFHFSDGDNLTSDNPRCLRYVSEIMERANMFGYGEVNQYQRNSTLMSAYKTFEHDKFRYFVLRKKSHVLEAMQHFFSREEV